LEIKCITLSWTSYGSNYSWKAKIHIIPRVFNILKTEKCSFAQTMCGKTKICFFDRDVNESVSVSFSTTWRIQKSLILVLLFFSKTKVLEFCSKTLIIFCKDYCICLFNFTNLFKLYLFDVWLNLQPTQTKDYLCAHSGC